MEAGKHYNVRTSDGASFGYFLDDHLYTCDTKTCIGILNPSGQLVNGHEILGLMDGDQLLKSDGTLLNIEH